MKKMNDLMDKAKIWYDLSAKQGYIPAKVGLAKMLLEDPTRDNVTRAIEIYEEADKANNVDAIYNLGFVHPWSSSHLDLLRGSLQHPQGSDQRVPLHRTRGGSGRRLRMLLPRLRVPPWSVRERQPQRRRADHQQAGRRRRSSLRRESASVSQLSGEGSHWRPLEGHALLVSDVSQWRWGGEGRHTCRRLSSQGDADR